jgi:hypothetical protein
MLLNLENIQMPLSSTYKTTLFYSNKYGNDWS